QGGQVVLQGEEGLPPTRAIPAARPHFRRRRLPAVLRSLRGLRLRPKPTLWTLRHALQRLGALAPLAPLATAPRRRPDGGKPPHALRGVGHAAVSPAAELPLAL